MLEKLELTIRRGETVALPIRVESDTVVYKAISAIAQSAPVRVTSAAHGLPDGWRAAVANVKGMTELNATGNPPKDSELRRVTVVDPNTVEFNALNAAGFKPYVSGGQLVYYKPFVLTGYTSAKLQVKDKVGGSVLLTLSTLTGELEIDTARNAVWIKLSATASASLTFRKGVFDIELRDEAGVVAPLCSADSVLIVQPEVTTI